MIKSSNIAIVVPARAGSIGILRKNLQTVKGRELVLRSIYHAKFLSSKVGGIIILSTDSDEIINLVKGEFGLKSASITKSLDFAEFDDFLLHFRPKSLATSESLIIDTLSHIREVLLSLEYTIEKWCLMQPTSPFRSTKAMGEIANRLLNNEDKDNSTISLTKVDDMHPARMYQIHGAYALPLQVYEDYYFKRRQDLPSVYIRDGAYYLLSDDLVASGSQYSEKPSFLLQEYPWNINIDTLNDLQIARIVEPQLLLEDPNS